MGTSIDAPCLDVIYKISEVTDGDGKFLPIMKLSKGKVTYPGRKQVFRIDGRKGRPAMDILGLEGEGIKGSPLLKKVVQKGKIVYKIPSLDEVRRCVKSNLSRLPEALKKVRPTYRYPVAISPGLKKLQEDLSRNLEKRR
jgi:nicotinate phosphoribosyltransferase